MQIARSPFAAVVLMAITVAAGCAATPEARWYQQRQALTTANKVYLANVPTMSDKQIVDCGRLLQTARASLKQAKDQLPQGGRAFNASLDIVEVVLKQLADTPEHVTANTSATQPLKKSTSHGPH